MRRSNSHVLSMFDFQIYKFHTADVLAKNANSKIIKNNYRCFSCLLFILPGWLKHISKIAEHEMFNLILGYIYIYNLKCCHFVDLQC